MASSFSIATILAQLILVAWIVRFLAKRKADRTFAENNGCGYVKRLPTRWPWGLDLVVEAFKHAREKKILQFMTAICEKTGPTFEQNILGARGIDTIEPDNIEAILSTNFHEYNLGERPPTFYPLLGHGIFTQTAAAWKRSRELLRPQFHSRRSQNFDEVQAAAERLIDRIPLNRGVDLQPLFFRFTLDTTTFLIFGKSINSLSSEKKGKSESDFAEAFRISQDYLAQRGRLGGFYWLIGGKEFKRNCKVCHDFVDEIVQEALSADEKGLQGVDSQGDSFLSSLIQETKDPIVLRDQLMNVLLAGRDTTACCLSWACRLLAGHQDVLIKLRHEVASTLGLGAQARLPEKADLKRMNYLNLVLKEVLRLYPSVPINSRSAITQTTLPVGGGPDGKAPVFVQKGEAVGYCVYSMHRRKDLYGPDAEAFRPERWETSTDQTKNALDDKALHREGVDLRNIGYGYLPFNAGPRTCLGQEFALLEAGYVLVRLMQKFSSMKPSRPQPAPGEETQDVTLVLSSADGCWVEMSQR